jgi:hypothetical protein
MTKGSNIWQLINIKQMAKEEEVEEETLPDIP